jgi:hypothetical protein
MERIPLDEPERTEIIEVAIGEYAADHSEDTIRDDVSPTHRNAVLR